jgi:putative endonuclease
VSPVTSKREFTNTRKKLVEGFTKHYSLNKLVYFEICGDIQNAIVREKQIKDGSRQKKIDLINSVNNKWCDLYDDL